MASNAENVSIWWRHHDYHKLPPPTSNLWRGWVIKFHRKLYVWFFLVHYIISDKGNSINHLRWCQPFHLHTGYKRNVNFKTLKHKRKGHHVADDILRCIFFYIGTFLVLVEISLKCVPGSEWHSPLRLSIRLGTCLAPSHCLNQGWASSRAHICINGPQWVKHYAWNKRICVY